MTKEEMRKEWCMMKGFNFIDFETLTEAEDYILFLESKIETQQNKPSLTALEISKEILYKPVTNNQAEQSIIEGALLIDNFAKEQNKIHFKAKLNEAIKKAKPNMDKIKDVDKYIENINKVEERECEHKNEIMYQGDGFVYVKCKDCGIEL